MMVMILYSDHTESPQLIVRVGADTVAPTTSVRDLGIYIDSDLSMRTQVTRTVAGCFAVLRQLRSICHVFIDVRLS